MSTATPFPMPTQDQLDAVPGVQAAFEAAQTARLDLAKAIAAPLLAAFVTKMPFDFVAFNEESSDFDDEGHGYATITDRFTLGENYPLRALPEWAWVEDTPWARDSPPCGGFFDDLADFLSDQPEDESEAPEEGDREPETLHAQLARLLGLDPNYVDEAIHVLCWSGLYASASREEDGTVQVFVSRVTG